MDEVLLTAMSKVEAILNGRPLVHVSVHLHDLKPSTPFHFFLVRASPTLLPDVFLCWEKCRTIGRKSGAVNTLLYYELTQNTPNHKETFKLATSF